MGKDNTFKWFVISYLAIPIFLIITVYVYLFLKWWMIIFWQFYCFFCINSFSRLEDYWHGEKDSENVQQRQERGRGNYSQTKRIYRIPQECLKPIKKKNDAWREIRFRFRWRWNEIQDHWGISDFWFKRYSLYLVFVLLRS